MSVALNPRTDGKLRDGLWIRQTPSVYSSSQILRWLTRINYPKADLSEHVISTFDTSLENLCLLLRLTLVAFPFENTQMHYTSHRIMDISHEGLFQRLVAEGNGSYCFGLNTLFLQMIRGLGYRAYPGAGRINEQPPNTPPIFLPFVHMVVFVQPKDGSETYLADACGGGSCITQPILLADGQTVMGTSPTETHTLIRSARPESSLATSPGGPNAAVEWYLIIRHKKPSGDSSERVCYSFIEDEFFQADYDAANVSVYSSKHGFFADNLVCAKCIWLGDEEMETLAGSENSEEIGSKTLTDVSISLTYRYMGRLTMDGKTVKRHIGPRSEVIKTMEKETDRIEVLRDIFGVDIPPEEIRFMKGRVPSLDG
ncbi:hypothetical protein D9758_005581 [Tetrapyrgos nigripes]|uniref:Arylamine N-acetyltransferase n=1 Tax=Tetrapyrgos nigripes TaxID=182062 RepID=A0A8H5GGY2_9AGAR|nr:hypothetical protein D9758_005581 [Tetrapyrgos nigripes]